MTGRFRLPMLEEQAYEYLVAEHYQQLSVVEKEKK